MDAALYPEMFALEGSHWWFTARHEIVRNLLRRFIRQAGERPRIGDLGCGCGMLLSLLAKEYDGSGIDASPQAVESAAWPSRWATSTGRFPGPVTPWMPS